MTRAAPTPRARVSRSVYRRRRIGVGIALLVALATGAYLPMTLLAPLEAVSAVVETPDPVEIDAPELDWPGYGASAIGALELPGVLARSGSERALPLASIVKLVTALVVLEEHPLDLGDEGPVITMSAADAGYYGSQLALNGSVFPVAAGERYTQRDLLELTLIKSANNFSTSLAVWAFGSERAFRDAAAAWLEEHGLASIRIVEPTGIDDASVGTVDDLVELGRIALADPVVADIVARSRETVSNRGTIENTNVLLGRDGINGIKTGTLFSFGANLLFSSTVPVGEQEVTVVGVVLGGPDHTILNRDIRRLLETAVANLAVVPLVEAGTAVGSYRTAWDAVAELRTTEAASILVWGDTAVTARIESEPIAVADAGREVGALVFDVAGQLVRVPLELATAIEDPGPWWRLTHPGLIVGAP